MTLLPVVPAGLLAPRPAAALRDATSVPGLGGRPVPRARPCCTLSLPWPGPRPASGSRASPTPSGPPQLRRGPVRLLREPLPPSGWGTPSLDPSPGSWGPSGRRTRVSQKRVRPVVSSFSPRPWKAGGTVLVPNRQVGLGGTEAATSLRHCGDRKPGRHTGVPKFPMGAWDSPRLRGLPGRGASVGWFALAATALWGLPCPLLQMRRVGCRRQERLRGDGLGDLGDLGDPGCPELSWGLQRPSAGGNSEGAVTLSAISPLSDLSQPPTEAPLSRVPAPFIPLHSSLLATHSPPQAHTPGHTSCSLGLPSQPQLRGLGADKKAWRGKDPARALESSGAGWEGAGGEAGGEAWQPLPSICFLLRHRVLGRGRPSRRQRSRDPEGGGTWVAGGSPGPPSSAAPGQPPEPAGGKRLVEAEGGQLALPAPSLRCPPPELGSGFAAHAPEAQVSAD